MIAPTSFFGDYGCHVRILEEARILQKFGHRVSIYTYQSGKDVPDIDIRRTVSIPWRKDWEVGSSWHKIGYDVLLSLRTLGALWEVKPDIIHAHLHEGALIGAVLSKLWGVPLVFDFQGSLTAEMVDHGFLSKDKPFYKPMRKLEQFIDRLAPRILTSSGHAADLLQTEFRFSPGKVHVVPDCVNTDVFAPLESPEEVAALRRAWGVPTSRTVIVYLGLLAEYQGIEHLLRAAQKVLGYRADVHFLIAGYPNVEKFQELARHLGILDYTTFPGRIRYADAPRVLAMGDIAVAPKLSKTEGAGKLLNYMAMALPTVAFDAPVSHEYLGDSGVYAELGNSDDLARCLEELVDAPERRRSLGDALRQRAQVHFSWETAGHLIVDQYASLI